MCLVNWNNECWWPGRRLQSIATIIGATCRYANPSNRYFGATFLTGFCPHAKEAALYNNLADLYHATGQPDAAMHPLEQAAAILSEVGVEAGLGNAEIWMLSER